MPPVVADCSINHKHMGTRSGCGAPVHNTSRARVRDKQLTARPLRRASQHMWVGRRPARDCAECAEYCGGADCQLPADPPVRPTPLLICLSDMTLKQCSIDSYFFLGEAVMKANVFLIILNNIFIQTLNILNSLRN